ncbi:MAG: MCP four helix bundle domain-containing protein [Bdellovibrionaceae bacterium]|nr:MCP four helix bundle domain-containing protein [Pseudobdellovibrionaceae bacterium]
MDFLNKLSFKVKLFLLCLFMAAVSITIGGISFFGLHRVTKTFEHITDVINPNLEQAGNMLSEFREVRVNFRTLGLPGISHEIEETALKKVQESIDNFEVAMDKYANLPFVPGEKEIFEEVKTSWKEFKAVGEKVIEINSVKSEDKDKKLLALFLNDCPKKTAAFTKHIRALMNFQKTESAKYHDLADGASSGTIVMMIATIFIGVLTGLSVGFIFARVVTNSIMEVTEHLAENADEVSAASTQIAASSQELSQAATEQAASLQETSSAVEELSSMVHKNAENAKSTASSTSESQQKATEGREAVDRMISSMDEINQSNEAIMNQINHSNQQMFEVVKVIQEIGNKTKVINDIVFQTKLLSFNASVEAARAGEHGKGFAVVAEEVGNLAQMSGNAAKEISTMLEGSIGKVESLVHETKNRVEALSREGKQKIENGVNVAQHCGEILGEIVNNVSGISSMASEISSASQEQSQGISEINKAMNQLDQVTQQNAAASGETASAAEKLSTQSISLKGSVEDLMKLMTGHGSDTKAAVSAPKSKVVHMHQPEIRHKKKSDVQIAKTDFKAASGDSVFPSRNDPGFGE